MKARYKKRIPVITTSVVFSNSEISGEGRMLDFTAPGCLIESPQKVAKGHYLQLQVALPGQSCPFTVKLAAVRWAKGTRFGLEFIKMDKRDQETLHAFMTAHMKSEASSGMKQVKHSMES